MLFAKYLIFVIFTISGANTEYDTEDITLIFHAQTESVIKSIDSLNDRLDNLSESLKLKNIELAETLKKFENQSIASWEETINTIKNTEERLLQKFTDFEANYSDALISNGNKMEMASSELKTIKDTENLKNQDNITETSSDLENFNQKTLFDVRIDKLNATTICCFEDPAPVDCETATRCSQKSGYYKIFIKANEIRKLLVFCDAEIDGGGWLSILRRQDGSVNFTRPRSDYANGFGNVESEYWLGLDNIYALTHINGRQELYVYIENWEGETRFARYDNFVVAHRSELYQLKSLGNYNGTAGDSLSYSLKARFSTIDRDYDRSGVDCANKYKAGWWFNTYALAVPTGQYLGNVRSLHGMEWYTFGGEYYSHKIMHLMIRSFKDN